MNPPRIQSKIEFLNAPPCLFLFSLIVVVLQGTVENAHSEEASCKVA